MPPNAIFAVALACLRWTSSVRACLLSLAACFFVILTATSAPGVAGPVGVAVTGDAVSERTEFCRSFSRFFRRSRRFFSASLSAFAIDWSSVGRGEEKAIVG